MADLIAILESFNRKERFFLIAHALGLHSKAREPAFSLSDCFREQLNEKIDVTIPTDPEKVFVAMDYHLDWLQAALIFAHAKQDGNSPFPNEGKEGRVIEGTQEDIDLLVAFKAGDQFHLILVEAKAYSGWTNKQLSSKATRLRRIFGEYGREWRDVQPHFCAIGHKESKGLDLEPLPKWMLHDGELHWLHLELPRERRLVRRCDREGDGYRNFKIEGLVLL